MTIIATHYQKKYKVLLIEDNPADISLIHEMLDHAQLADFELENSNRVTTGLQKFLNEKFDVVLLDLSLPDAIKLEALNLVIKSTTDLPIIILTGADDADQAITAVRKGAQDYLIKGQFDGHLLVRAIHYAIERKTLENALRESERKYRNLVNNLPDIVLEIDSEGKIIFISPQIFELSGYTPEELIGTNSLEFIHPDDISNLEEAIRRIRTGESVINYECRGKHKDGHYVWISTSSQALRKDDKSNLVSIVRDISSRKQIEEALMESEIRYRQLVETSPVGIILTDIVGDIINSNIQGARILGYEAEYDLIGTNIFEMIETENQENALRAFKEALETGKGKISEYNFIKKDSISIPVEMNTAVIRDTNKNLSYFMAIVKDISKQKEAEDALRESEKKYRTILDSIVDGYYETDLAGNFTFFNNQFCDLLEYPRNELLGTNYEAFSDEKTTRLFYQTFNTVYKTGKSTKGAEWEVLLKNGTRRYLEVSISLITDSLGKSIGFRGIARDVTERKGTELMLHESREKMRAFMDSATDSFYLLDSNLTIVDLNLNALKLSDLSRKQIIGKNVIDLDSIIKDSNRIAKFREVLKSGTHFIEYDKVPHPIYGEKHYSVRVFQVGEGLGIISTDITQQRMAQQVVQLSEERLRLAQQVAHLGFWDWDLLSGDLYWSDESYRMFGFDPQVFPMTYDKVLELIHPEDIPVLEEHVNAALKDNAEFDIVVRGLLPSGEVRYFHGLGKVTHDANGNVIRFMGTQLDITDRMRHEEALHASEEHFRKIFNEAPIGMALVDLDFRFEKVNIAFCEMLGYSREELTKLTFPEITHPEHVQRDLEHVDKLLRREEFEYKTEERYFRKNNEILWARTSVTTLFDNNGDPNYNLAMIEDISHQKRVEEEMRRQIMKFKIEDGSLYLVKESSATLSKEVFRDLIEVGYPGLVISRIPEKEFRMDFEEKCEFLWFSEIGDKKCISPILDEIEKALEANPSKTIVWMDRLDYVISKCGFEETLKSVFRWREIAYLKDIVIILSVDPATLTNQQIRSLEKETKAIEPRILLRVPDELFEVLRYTYQQNILGVKPSYSDVGYELRISKPTSRKRIKRLAATGYLNEEKHGNRKILEVTEKGLMLFRNKAEY